MHRHETYRGILLRICGTLFFSLMGVLIKKVGTAYPTGEVVFARSIFSTIPVFAMLVARGEFLEGIKTKNPMMHLSRVSAGVVGMFCGFGALRFLPLPDVTAIGFAAPLFTVVFSVFLLKEKVRYYRWLAVGAGFFGVGMIFSPHIFNSVKGLESASTLLGASIALIGALFAALAMISVRRLAKVEKTSVIVFYFAVGSASMALLSAPLGWTLPTPADGALLVSIGLSGGIGQILLTQSYRYAEASVVAPFDYATLLWAIIFGWIFFADMPTWPMLAGAALVIAAGIYVIWREHGEITAMQEAAVKT